MGRRLVCNITSDYIAAANRLKPNRSKKRIVAYVESYDDITFWRDVLDEYETENVCFEIMLPSRTTLGKGKKTAMMNNLGPYMIACVDADYDFLLQGATETSRQIINSPYILHTYAYAIENLKCYAESLKQVCVQSTLNDTDVLDIPMFMKMYSQICYPLFVWNILLYRIHDLKTMSMQHFCEIVRLTSFNIENPAISLKQLEERVNHKVKYLQKHFPHLVEKHDALKEELATLGILPEECYFYIQGHHIMDCVVMRILTPVCRFLRSRREVEIEKYAYHRQQYSNELSSYRHSQCDVALMLSKNTAYTEAAPFKRLQNDIENLLKSLDNI